MKVKVEPITILFIAALIIAFGGGFGTGWSLKDRETYNYVTEYITQTQTQEQWQAQVDVTVVNSDFQSNINIQLKDITNITINTTTNYMGDANE